MQVNIFKVVALATLALTLSFGLAGCGSSTSGPSAGEKNDGTRNDKPTPGPVAASVSCTLEGGTVCTEFDANVLLPQQKQELQTDCRGRGGVYLASACSTGNHVGTCRLKSEGVPVKIRLYLPITLDQAQQACIEQGGTFQSNY